MDLFYQIICIRNLEPIIKKAEILVDESIGNILGRINSLLWNTEEGGIQIEPFEVYAEMFPDTWDELRSRFIKHAESFTVDIATRRHFGELWVHNNIKNLDQIIGSSNADGLIGKFKSTPGILVSAGPSLQKNVHLLKGLEDKCVIMAAGTAVRVLEDFGITPHFMVGIDAGDNEGKIHANVKSKDIHFIYSNQVSTLSVASYDGPKFVMNYPVDLYTAKFFEYSNIKSGFSRAGRLLPIHALIFCSRWAAIPLLLRDRIWLLPLEVCMPVMHRERLSGTIAMVKAVVKAVVKAMGIYL